jgi:hypothetical protein
VGRYAQPPLEPARANPRQHPPSNTREQQLPALPTVNDFRTSLILPE